MIRSRCSTSRDDLDRAVLDDDEEHDPELDVNADDLLAGGRGRIVVRRPGPHVPDADGRDSAADPAAGGCTGQADRDHPHEVPPQGPGMRLRDADGGEGAAARPRRRVAVRPHRAGLRDRSAREAPDFGAAAAQSAHAGNSAEAEPARLQHRHRQVAGARPSAGRRGAGWAAAADGPSGWSRNSVCARSGSSR